MNENVHKLQQDILLNWEIGNTLIRYMLWFRPPVWALATMFQHERCIATAADTAIAEGCAAA
ncbi:hypothetical protein LPH44_02030 [Xylella taiwanensis]|uniref:Uncharacterized protein n=1 Tax=Xylella taiwanensis TaxID=1444770 RepID=Z9JFZ0_9GAMM|nr:hypothetical protein [Xylella taiwanensis]AXI82820.1 hypothetical protein AB672_02035 [Xylella taiwanensis]EWS77320.1 hypothetical protein AF72_11525 [Xylella taiwanensis]MCD8455832.1 hypothetical protein [Xylella taiwanensis]MCD8458237.1 hypothetical protein [Xylella taiwanensis]QKD97814.1 hypothetical protein PLS229_02030 [Xylella taiwanensis]